jgi:cation transport ATPase
MVDEHRQDHATHDGAHAHGSVDHHHVAQAPQTDQPLPAGTIYTCPMHPQIRQLGPGNCPICGMTLEPILATAETGPSPELLDMTRRFWVGLSLTTPVFVLEMGAHLFNLHHYIPPQISNWIQFALTTPVVLWAGWPFFARAGQSLVTGQSQHVHAHRHGYGRGMALQRRRDIGSVPLSAGVP